MATQISSRFQDKTVVVTASSEGIGLAIARRFAQEGAYVVISSRNQQKVDKALSELHAEGLTNIDGVVCDVTSNADQQALLKYTLDRRPGIDVLVSNAGQPYIGPILEATETDWEESMNVNIKSHLFLTQKFVPHIKKQGKGSIIYISSIAGYLPDFGLYGLAKAALISLTRTLASTLAPDNIRVNCIGPGFIDTNMAVMALTEFNLDEKKYLNLTMMKRFGKCEEIGGIATFLASDDASYITGEVIMSAGGTHTRV